MTAKKAVLQLRFDVERIRKKAFVTVSQCPGVTSITTDDKAGKMTVVGEFDVPVIVMKLRKICNAEIVSVEVSTGSSMASKEEKMASKEEKKFISLVTDLTFYFSSVDWNSKADLEAVSLITQLLSADSDEDWSSLDDQIRSCKPKMELISLIHQIIFEELDSEWKVVLSVITQIMLLVSSMVLDSESGFKSLIKQIISLFNSKPDSDSELVSLITQTMRLEVSAEQSQEYELVSLISQLNSLKPELELTSLIKQIISRFRSMNWVPRKLMSLRPQVMVTFTGENFYTTGEKVQHMESKKGECRLEYIQFWRSNGIDWFHCQDCHGQYHEECDKAPVEIKHPLHPKHSLQLVLFSDKDEDKTRGCYCCNKDLQDIFYYCSACDLAMSIACVEKQPVLSIDHPKWHEHSLALFPSRAFFPCKLCALAAVSSPSYICPPCDFIVHQKCLSLPHVTKIFLHPHRISFTSFFEKGDWSCGVCRRQIDNDNGGYSCIRDDCLYAAHSGCATRKNVWDGRELKGVPDLEGEVKPFVMISDAIIQHFSHEHHYLKFHEDTSRFYNEDKQCQACITPIYFGNFYSCVECDFILHENCANLPRTVFHPIHPHLLTLVGGYDGVIDCNDKCSACRLLCTGGFFYECGREKCDRFKLHVHCATISEPLEHPSHGHPLYVISKRGEQRTCGVCKESRILSTKEIFSCIEEECEFSLCFACATIPQRVRYTDDKHILTLCYGLETSKTFWCEICEQEINPKERFYKCDEYCCVTIHMECLIGKDLYMKSGLLLSDSSTGRNIKVMPNDHHIARPFCSQCKKLCPQKIVFESSGLVYCSLSCVY